jgi:hypothetical protein
MEGRTRHTRRIVLAVLAALQLALAGAAWTDLARRPARLVRGPKWIWALVIAVNFVGPLWYLRWGRLPDPGPAAADPAAPAAPGPVLRPVPAAAPASE